MGHGGREGSHQEQDLSCSRCCTPRSSVVHPSGYAGMGALYPKVPIFDETWAEWRKLQ